jgi:hypothetical protein
LGDAIARLAPAEAATDVKDPNLVAWHAVADVDQRRELRSARVFDRF